MSHVTKCSVIYVRNYILMQQNCCDYVTYNANVFGIIHGIILSGERYAQQFLKLIYLDLLKDYFMKMKLCS